jgi:6-phosphogluconolactonase
MPYFMYLSISGEEKIAIYTMDGDTGALTFQEDVPTGKGVMPLAVDSDQEYFYAGLRGGPEVQSYRLDRQTGKISLLGTTPLDWDTTYMELDKTDRFLLSASYGGGVAGVHAIGEDGIVQAQPVDRHDTAQCAHYIQTDKSNRFAFLPHVADANTIYQYLFDEKTGHLTPNNPPRVSQPPGSGPRHYCHHPEKDYVYADNEQGCSVTAYHLDPDQGTLEAFQTVSTLPDDFTDENTCAQIHIHPSGRFIYASNRGHDSIACFSINQETGLLSVIGQVTAAGTPRAFNLDPEGHFLFAAGQANGQLAAYRIDQASGALSPLTIYDVGPSPSWVMILKLEG